MELNCTGIIKFRMYPFLHNIRLNHYLSGFVCCLPTYYLSIPAYLSFFSKHFQDFIVLVMCVHRWFSGYSLYLLFQIYQRGVVWTVGHLCSWFRHSVCLVRLLHISRTMKLCRRWILLNIMFHAPMGRFQLELIYYFTYFSLLSHPTLCVSFQ